MAQPTPLSHLIEDIKGCTICTQHLPLGPRPVFSVSKSAKIMIVGQAPGTRVHETGIPWNDPSGDKLREWMGVDKAQFYDTSKIAIVPTGFCYPGKGKSGDRPPRPECAPTWHPSLLEHLTNLELTILTGQYAQAYYLAERRKKNLTETVKAYHEYLPDYLVMPHPSPRNRIWLRRNAFFEQDIVPYLQARVAELL